MNKFLFPLVLGMAALPALADDGALPAFADVQIQISNEGKPVYTAFVLVPRSQEVVDDTVKTSTMAISCSRDVTVTPPPVYQDGVRITLAAVPWGNETMVRLQYSVATSKRDEEFSPFGERCNRLNVDNVSHGGNVANFIRTGEAMNIKNDDVKITVTVKATYMAAPAGRVPGQFLHG
ncbi:MAG: hypothetical protein V4582_06490 [Pseudomonadota bacterium]